MSKRKNIPHEDSPQHDALLLNLDLPPDPVSAWTKAVKQIRVLQIQRDKLVENLAFLEVTLRDLAACRKDNMSLRSDRTALEVALSRCQSELVKTKKQPPRVERIGGWSANFPRFSL